ncbi:acyltransferase [Cryobacterium tagatosivorans]|uniref:Acyltransferase n=1 Tax=Cryobacterium tagatosivorans TaxID=1259199 RepID=A0A4R8UDA4_9MICO|nr:acyltransferase [Cryobacterium tagatosivorans]TFB47789.1 acyltransferase [Cryobacterium tagatosivorans]
MRRLKTVLRRMAMLPRLIILRTSGVSVGTNVRVYGRVRIHRAEGSTISLASNVVLNADARRNTLESRGPVILKTLSPHALLSIGKDSGMTSATISSASEISIGDRVLIGAGVLITDSDHHVVRPPTGMHRRYLGFPPVRAGDRVRIADDVFIGARSIVLKGVSIGARSVIGAGSVVVNDIPPDVIAAGNPCRVLGTL